jgi:hypothetical protein
MWQCSVQLEFKLIWGVHCEACVVLHSITVMFPTEYMLNIQAFNSEPEVIEGVGLAAVVAFFAANDKFDSDLFRLRISKVGHGTHASTC